MNMYHCLRICTVVRDCILLCIFLRMRIIIYICALVSAIAHYYPCLRTFAHACALMSLLSAIATLVHSYTRYLPYLCLFMFRYLCMLVCSYLMNTWCCPCSRTNVFTFCLSMCFMSVYECVYSSTFYKYTYLYSVFRIYLLIYCG